MKASSLFSQYTMFQTTIQTLKKQYNFIIKNPFETSLITIFNVLEAQHALITRLNNFCLSLLNTVNKTNNFNNDINTITSGNKNDGLSTRNNSTIDSFRTSNNNFNTLGLSTSSKLNYNCSWDDQETKRKSKRNKRSLSETVLQSTNIETIAESKLNDIGNKDDNYVSRNSKEKYKKEGINVGVGKEYVTIKGKFNIKPTNQTKDLLKKSYCVLDNYLSHNSKKEEMINDDWS